MQILYYCMQKKKKDGLTHRRTICTFFFCARQIAKSYCIGVARRARVALFFRYLAMHFGHVHCWCAYVLSGRVFSLILKWQTRFQKNATAKTIRWTCFSIVFGLGLAHVQELRRGPWNNKNSEHLLTGTHCTPLYFAHVPYTCSSFFQLNILRVLSNPIALSSVHQSINLLIRSYLYYRKP